MNSNGQFFDNQGPGYVYSSALNYGIPAGTYFGEITSISQNILKGIYSIANINLNNNYNSTNWTIISNTNNNIYSTNFSGNMVLSNSNSSITINFTNQYYANEKITNSN